MPKPTDRPVCCDRPMQPLDLLQAWVETEAGVTLTGRDDDPLDYDPTGTTHPFWDTQVTVGYCCTRCGTATLTSTTLHVGDRTFTLTS
jgi:hypothetical protein